MKIVPRTWPVMLINERRSRIDPRPQYQRSPVWNETKKQLLIDSILRGYDIPKFYLRATTGKFEHEVTDGQQRLRAIWSFLNNEFALGEESNDLPELGNLSGKSYDDPSIPFASLTQGDNLQRFREALLWLREQVIKVPAGEETR